MLVLLVFIFEYYFDQLIVDNIVFLKMYCGIWLHTQTGEIPRGESRTQERKLSSALC